MACTRCDPSVCHDTRGGGCVVGRRWYVAVTTAGGEFLARSELLARSEATGLSCFLPLDKPRVVVRFNRAGREVSRKHIPVPLLRGYLFVQFDPRRDHWQSIYSTPGLERLLGMDRYRPEPIPTAFVERLMREATLSGVVTEPVRVLLDVGAQVRVVDHHLLEGQAGEVTEARPGRVKVAFQGFSFELWIDAKQAKVIPREAR
jgi:transcription antitermination factor NusG